MADIEKMIRDTLGIPVIELFEPVLPPCATWYPLSDETGLEGDGKEAEEVSEYQIDLWDRDRERVRENGRRLKRVISQLETAAIPDLSYFYDNNGKMWRAMLTFSEVRKGLENGRTEIKESESNQHTECGLLQDADRRDWKHDV